MRNTSGLNFSDIKESELITKKAKQSSTSVKVVCTLVLRCNLTIECDLPAPEHNVT